MSEAPEEPKAPETKAQLVQFIKSWIETDNEIRKLQKDCLLYTSPSPRD